MNRRVFFQRLGCALVGVLALKAEEVNPVVVAQQDEAQFVAIPKTQFNDGGEWRDVFYSKPVAVTPEIKDSHEALVGSLSRAIHEKTAGKLRRLIG